MGQGWFIKTGLALALALVQAKNADVRPPDPQQAVAVTGYLVELDCMTIQTGATLELLHQNGCVRRANSKTARFAIMVRNAAHTVYTLDRSANARLIKFAGMLEDRHNVVITVIGSLEENKAIAVSWIGQPEAEGTKK